MINSTSNNRERRDWTLLIFIIPIGILFMVAAGQVAIRLVPEWSVNAGMQSNLDLSDLPKQQSAPLQPVLPAILTPLGWLDTFLTPGAGHSDQVLFPSFVIFEPSATPEVTLAPPTVATQPSPTAPTPTQPTVVSPPPTGTKEPPDGGGETPTPSPSPSAPPPVVLPPVVSTPTGTYVDSSPWMEFALSDLDGGLGTFNIGNGTYVVLDLGATPIEVEGASDTNYDLVYYELENPSGYISMDQVIIGISRFSNGSSYYAVLNWGDGEADTNTNIGDVSGPEYDNQAIDVDELYGPVGYQTGVLIDVDNASSHPPAGFYRYLVIVAPVPSTPDDGTQVDAGTHVDFVEIVDEINPTTDSKPAPVEIVPAPPVIEQSQPVDEAPAAEEPSEPVEAAPPADKPSEPVEAVSPAEAAPVEEAPP